LAKRITCADRVFEVAQRIMIAGHDKMSGKKDAKALRRRFKKQAPVEANGAGGSQVRRARA